jgi:hypothetical protein
MLFKQLFLRGFWQFGPFLRTKFLYKKFLKKIPNKSFCTFLTKKLYYWTYIFYYSTSIMTPQFQTLYSRRHGIRPTTRTASENTPTSLTSRTDMIS